MGDGAGHCHIAPDASVMSPAWIGGRGGTPDSLPYPERLFTQHQCIHRVLYCESSDDIAKHCPLICLLPLQCLTGVFLFKK